MQVLRVGESQAERLGPILDELATLTGEDQSPRGYFRAYALLFTVLLYAATAFYALRRPAAFEDARGLCASAPSVWAQYHHPKPNEKSPSAITIGRGARLVEAMKRRR